MHNTTSAHNPTVDA